MRVTHAPPISPNPLDDGRLRQRIVLLAPNEQKLPRTGWRVFRREVSRWDDTAAGFRDTFSASIAALTE